MTCTDWEAAVIRRIAWAMKVPMTKALSVILEITIQCCDRKLICKSCEDKKFCNECPFKQVTIPRCTNDDTCPYCGVTIENLYRYFFETDPKLDCPHCHKPIKGTEVFTYRLVGGEDGPA